MKELMLDWGMCFLLPYYFYSTSGKDAAYLFILCVIASSLTRIGNNLYGR